MSKSRLQWKVGLFVFIGLGLLAALLIEFSKGLTFFRHTYVIYLQTENVGGLKPRATVLMSGVQVGTVSDITLSPAGTNVTVTLSIFSKYEIHRDARFKIQQSGFLGDQYVAIIPTRNQGEVFHNKDEAKAEPPFDLLEFVGSSKGLLDRVDSSIRELEGTITNVNTFLLSPHTLTNVSDMVTDLRALSEKALVTVDGINSLLATNSPAVSVSVSNLSRFSGQLNDAATGLTNLLAANRPVLDHAVKNVESSTEILKSMMDDVQAGKGPIGGLLRNEQLAADVSQITSNLTVTTSNLNRLGLWGILWRHRAPAPKPSPAHPLVAPKERKGG